MNVTKNAKPILIALLGIILLAPASLARDRGHDKLRQAVERGEIKPLADILELVRAKLPGEIAAVEAERKKGRWVYEFRTIDAKGRLREVYVDAQSAEIVKIEEK